MGRSCDLNIEGIRCGHTLKKTKSSLAHGDGRGCSVRGKTSVIISAMCFFGISLPGRHQHRKLNLLARVQQGAIYISRRRGTSQGVKYLSGVSYKSSFVNFLPSTQLKITIPHHQLSVLTPILSRQDPLLPAQPKTIVGGALSGTISIDSLP